MKTILQAETAKIAKITYCGLLSMGFLLAASAQGFNALARVTLEKHTEIVTNGAPTSVTRVVDGRTNQFLEYELISVEVTEQVTRLQVGSTAVATNHISQSPGGPRRSQTAATGQTNSPPAPRPVNTNSPAYQRRLERERQRTNSPAIKK